MVASKLDTLVDNNDGDLYKKKKNKATLERAPSWLNAKANTAEIILHLSPFFLHVHLFIVYLYGGDTGIFDDRKPRTVRVDFATDAHEWIKRQSTSKRYWMESSPRNVGT